MSKLYEVTIPVTIQVWGEDTSKVKENILADLESGSFSFAVYPGWLVKGDVVVKPVKEK